MKRTAIAVLAGLSLSLTSVALAGTKTVKVDDDVFKPGSLTVKKGTKVKFKWVGDNPHDVKVTSGPRKFESETKTSGTYTKKMRKKGTYKIVCTIHSGMKMTLKVN